MYVFSVTLKFSLPPLKLSRTENLKLPGGGSGANRRQEEAGVTRSVPIWIHRDSIKTQLPNTLASKTFENRNLYCADDKCFGAADSRWQTLSGQAEILTHTIYIKCLPAWSYMWHYIIHMGAFVSPVFDGWRLVWVELCSRFSVLKEYGFLFTNIHSCYVRATLRQWLTVYL